MLKHVTTMLRARFGLLGNYGAGDGPVPAYERFRLGGGTTLDPLRGYDDYQVVPAKFIHDVYDTTSQTTVRVRYPGGRFMTLYTAEQQFPIVHPVHGVFFFDAGNMWDLWREIRPFDLKLGAGVGSPDGDPDARQRRIRLRLRLQPRRRTEGKGHFLLGNFCSSRTHGFRLRTGRCGRASCCCSLPAPRRGRADLRVGYIDSGKIFHAVQGRPGRAQPRFDRQVQGWRDEASEKQTAVKQLRAEPRDQSPILSRSSGRRRKKPCSGPSATTSVHPEDLGAAGLGRAGERTATQGVVASIRSAVEKVAADKGLTLVLDAASGFIIYADSPLDLTADVIAELNSRATASPPPTTPH